jgi:intracellular sulfur oxidation DsrE/DsrF family protein
MPKSLLYLLAPFCILILNTQVIADSPANTASPGADSANAPWGGASVTDTEYKPQKVVYDVHVQTAEAVASVLDRASYLSTITGADPFDQSIVLVLHGRELSFFAIKNYQKHKELMQRAQSLVESEALSIRMCKIAAQSQGYSPEDIHGFIEMVPMGDAEIIRLQYEEAHAYMQ